MVIASIHASFTIESFDYCGIMRQGLGGWVGLGRWLCCIMEGLSEVDITHFVLTDYCWRKENK